MLNLPLQVIDRHVCEVDEALVTFSNIDQLVARLDARTGLTSRHLVLIVNAASPDAVAQRDVYLQFNGDTGDNYNDQELTGVAGDDDAARLTGVAQLVPFPIPGTDYDYAFGGGLILIPHAFGTVDHTAVLALGGAAEDEVKAMAGRWANIAAITSVTLAPDTGNFIAGSVFTLAVVDESYLVEEIEDAAADFTPTFDNIPQGEGDLVAIGYARSDRAADNDSVFHTINDDDVVGNYWAQYLRGLGGNTSAVSENSRTMGYLPGDDATPNAAFGAFAAIYSQYTKQNQPHYLSLTGFHESSTPMSLVDVYSGRRANIEPINKLAWTPGAGTDFKAGSLFSLYRVPKRLIERQVLTADQATITFDNIPDYYEALILHVYARSDSEMGSQAVQITINADAVLANYNKQELFGVLGVVTAQRSEGNRSWLLISDNAQPAGEFSGGSLLFLGYAEADRHKHVIGLFGHSDNSVVIQSSRWLDVDAIISIALTTPFNNFLAGSVFELEGVLRKEGLPADAGMTFGV